jgi:hypothetical protein
MLDILNLINQSCLLNLLRALLIALLIAGTRSATKIRVTLLIHSPAFTLVLGSQFSLLLFNALSVTSLVGKVLFEVLVDGPVGHIPSALRSSHCNCKKTVTGPDRDCKKTGPSVTVTAIVQSEKTTYDQL